GEWRGMEAELIRIRLQNEGILCSLDNQAIAQTYSNMLGGVRVQVPEDQLEAAREILKRPVEMEGADDEDEGYVEEEWRCPKCHSKNVAMFPMETWELL